MTSRGEVEVKGASDLLKLLKTLPDEIADKVIRSSQREAIQAVVAEAKVLAPKDSGRLEEHISSTVFRDKKTGNITARVGIVVRNARQRQKLRQKLAAKGQAGAIYDAYYAVFVERGTRYQKPQHFMARAFHFAKRTYGDRLVAIAVPKTDRLISQLSKGA